jgi:hypothetical protein
MLVASDADVGLGEYSMHMQWYILKQKHPDCGNGQVRTSHSTHVCRVLFDVTPIFTCTRGSVAAPLRVCGGPQAAP